MSEIEKLMQNAGVEKDWKPLPYGDIEEYYPEFTAEKQFELEKTILNKGYRKISYYITSDGDYSLTFDPDATDANSVPYVTWGENRAEILADLINYIWNDLEKQEKAEIKRILE